MATTFPAHVRDDSDDEETARTTQYASKRQSFSQPKPFQLQAPPIKVHSATPNVAQNEFDQLPVVNEHAPAAPGEQTYDAVPIPGAYASPLASPAFQPPPMGNLAPGQAITTEERIQHANVHQ